MAPDSPLLTPLIPSEVLATLREKQTRRGYYTNQMTTDLKLVSSWPTASQTVKPPI